MAEDGGILTGSFEHGNETSGSVKCFEFLC